MFIGRAPCKNITQYFYEYQNSKSSFKLFPPCGRDRYFCLRELVNRHIDCPGRSGHGTGFGNDELECNGCFSDLFYPDGNIDLVPRQENGLVIGFGMDQRKRDVRVFQKLLDPQAQGFQEMFLGLMDQIKLVGKEKTACRVGMVQINAGAVCEHKDL